MDWSAIDYAHMLKSGLINPDAAVPPEVGRYKEYLQSYPEESTYQPSRIRKILGALAAGQTGLMTLGNIPLAERSYNTVTRAPYHQAVQKFMEGSTAPRMQAEEAVKESQLSMEAKAALAKQIQELSSGAESKAKEQLAEFQQTPSYYKQRYGYQPQSLQEIEDITKISHPITDTPDDRWKRAQLEASEAFKRAQLGTSEAFRRAQLHENQANYRAGLRGTKSTVASPQKEAQAQKLADDRIYANFPEYRKYYDEQWAAGGKYVLKPTDPNTDPNYKAFLSRRKQITDELTSSPDENDWEQVEE